MILRVKFDDIEMSRAVAEEIVDKIGGRLCGCRTDQDSCVLKLSNENGLIFWNHGAPGRVLKYDMHWTELCS